MDNSAQLCCMCGVPAQLMFECPQLRTKHVAGELNEHGHPAS